MDSILYFAYWCWLSVYLDRMPANAIWFVHARSCVAALTEALSSPGDALVVLSTAVRMSPLPSSLLMDIEVCAAYLYECYMYRSRLLTWTPSSVHSPSQTLRTLRLSLILLWICIHPISAVYALAFTRKLSGYCTVQPVAP